MTTKLGDEPDISQLPPQPNQQSVWIDNEVLDLVLRGQNAGDRPMVLLTQDDGTLRSFSLQVHTDGTGRERVSLVENDGTIRQQMVLWETTTPGAIRWRGEPTLGEACVSLYGTDTGGAIRGIENEVSGELRAVMLGSDEAGNLDRLRTDANRTLWTRPYDGYLPIDPVEIPAADAVLWNPGATAAQRYEVNWLIVNNDPAGADRTVSVGVKIDGVAAVLAAPEFAMFNEIVPYPGTSGERGPFIINGNDDIRGVASLVNTLSIHFKVRRLDTGV